MKIKDDGSSPNSELSTATKGNSSIQNGDIVNPNKSSKFHNGNLATSNGTVSHDKEPELQTVFEGTNTNESRDSGSPIDLIPFNIEGIQTVVKNTCGNAKQPFIQNGGHSQNLLEAELRSCREENVQLRAGLKEASRVNQQWRTYHDEKQNYVQKLLTSLHDLQEETSLKQSNGKTSAEIQRLRNFITRQQKEHDEHIQLLQLQVKAHRDDWEAERSEKKAAEIGRLQAESQLQATRQELAEAKCLIKDLEARIKLCKCFAGSDSVSSYDYSGLPFRHQNGNLLPLETTSSSRVSPSFSSNNSLCSSSASRCSSVSKELSNNSSPTILKNAQTSPSCTINYEHNGAHSPTVSIGSKSSSTKSHESHGWFEKTDSSSRGNSHSSQSNQSEELNSECKLKSHSTVNIESNRNKTKRTEKSDAFSESSNFYESKGARPKHFSNKRSDEEERKAKRRARSILASALPMSPSSSQPGSPVNVASNKPVSSTDKEFHSSKVPFSVSEVSGNSEKINEKNENTNFPFPNSGISRTMENLKTSVCDLGTCVAKTESRSKCENQKYNITNSKGNEKYHSESDGHIYEKCKISPIPDRKFENTNNQNNCRQCSAIQSNELRTYPRSSTRSTNLENNNNTNNSLEIKTASKMKQNTKSLIVTNNHDKCNTNYASITIMPGPSSALFSRTQTASNTSSRSSSPGISLTTFALNANGQGVPGAIFFALGTDANPAKASQCQEQNETSMNQQNTQSQQLQNLSTSENSEEISKSNITISTDANESNNKKERIVNSAWVQLSESDSSNSKLTPKSPWRTARVVPSHKLNSVRKSHANENCKNISPTFNEEFKRHENYYNMYSYGNNNVCHCTGSGHTKYQQTQDTRYQISLSPIPCFPSCSRGSPNLSYSSGQSFFQNDEKSRKSPNICIIPHTSCSQNCTDSDLRSIASKNISSAILSYECGNLGCSTIHSGKYVVDNSNANSNYEDKNRFLQPSIEKPPKDCYLVCPSCQKLFHREKNTLYERHIEACRGPKYADM